MLKTRFCPSPTGLMHLGNVRTALFNALLAHGKQGSFLVRIEDTDKARSTEEFSEKLLADLVWLDLLWDEGPTKDQGRGPYWQSQRQAIYDKYYARLEEMGLVYPCFCSDEELALTRKVQLASGQPPRYAGTCLHLSSEEIAAKKAAGMRPTLRFQVPKQKIVEFTDLVRGIQRFNTDVIGDFIIRRADGTASFLFSNAIDDALMEVTHALRGEDHLANTPRQLLIVQALGLGSPIYAHISMILAKDGSPLSKRNGSRSIQDLREAGYFASAIINYLARLGHYYESNKYMSISELAQLFKVENLSSSPAKYDPDQLLFWQKEAIAHASDDELINWLGEVLSQVPSEKRDLFLAIVKSNAIFPSDAQRWVSIFFNELEYTPETKSIINQAGGELLELAINLLPNYQENFSEMAKELQQKTGLKGKQLFQPLRLAMTGEQHGPEMAQIIKLLGIEKVQARLKKASTL